MNSTLCTIGFAGKTAEEFFRLLQEAGVTKVIDVRENRTGQLSGFAKFPDVAFFLDRLGGIAYEHEPLFAPSPEIRDIYRASKDWPAYEAAFLELMRQRDVPARCDPSRFEGIVALLCSEPTAERCHRRLLVELLAEKFHGAGHSVAIRHLSIEKAPPKPQKARRKKIASPAL
ncbi:MAG TPA: DUF488 domain-containing protein [Candidatus Acidoferrales bacterium]